MTTLLYTHPVFLEHDTGYGHPECPARLTAILNALKHSSFAALQWRDAPLAAIEQLTRIHTATHVERTLSRIPKHGHYAIDGDTIVSPQSGEAALRAAGAVCAAVDAILQGEADNAFARFGRRAIMRSPTKRWASVCSAMPQSALPTPGPFTI